MKNPRERKDSGVSEVVGTILTLSITVTLFSTVFLMLGNLPEPTGTTYANFDMDATQMSDNSVWLNITHKGGETLNNYSTTVYVIADENTVYAYSIWDGLGSEEWRPGETWTYHVNETVPIDLTTGYVYIFDNNRNSIIWRENFAGGITTPLPPIIMDRGSTPSDISTTGSFRLYAYVKDPNDDFYPDEGEGSLTVDLSVLHLYSGGNPVNVVSFHHDVGYKYVTPLLNASASTPIGSHVAEITATDDDGNIAKDLVKFTIGQASTEDCDIYISQISFSPQNPVTGETTQISVTFSNAGNSYGYCTPHLYDNYSNTITTIVTGSTVYVAAHGESTRTYTWTKPSPAGIHNISVYAEIPSGSPEDSDLSNNNETESLSVIPKILLVDDDHDQDFNTAAYMMEALNATGYNYDVYRVAYTTDDGPQYSTLSQYDVVIWMTGKDLTYSLTVSGTTADTKNLESFLNGGGKLWLIGENIMNNPFLVSAFITPYMGASLSSSDVSLPSQINGSDPTLGNIHNISMSATGYDNGKYTDFISLYGTTSSPALYDTSTHSNIAISNDPGTYSTMLFSFEFSAIKYASDRAQITYETLKWLSGINGKTGRDVSIAGVRMDPEYPLYKDNVNISLYVRNNGWQNETVRVQLLVDMTDVSLAQSIVTVEKNGGINITWGAWDANILGTHRLIARVDPYNEISESDETNNVMIQDFLVRFRTLIVDDDDSINNGGTSTENTTAYVTDAFDHLLSTRSLGSNYSQTSTIWVVDHDNNGPDFNNMSRYNAVIWVTGKDTTNTFTESDMDNISKYLNANGMLWIIGDGFVNDFLTSGLDATKLAFLSDLGVNGSALAPGADAASGFEALFGVTDDEISHGIRYTMDASLTSGADALRPVDDADAIMTDENAHNVSLKYDHGYKVVTTTFDIGATHGLYETYDNPHFEIPSDIGNRTRYELTYLVMHWFGQINNNAELKVGSDLYINGDPIDQVHLVLGESYILEAKIHNVGDTDVYYTTARFYDGDSIIGSTSISSVEDSTATASIIWKPSYAGDARALRVIVDYHEEVQEMPNPANLSENLFEYNNEAVHYVPVYFFWDDMENGTANWMHNANIVNINGENPIDFLGGGYTNIYTDVIYQWNTTMSSGGKWIDTTYHSYNRSYWLEEPSPTGVPIDQITTQNIPLDVVFALDTSGSMSGTPIANMKEATKDFIRNLTDQDRTKIWIFNGGGSTSTAAPELLYDWMYMTDANKNIAINQVDSITAGGYTPFYDTLGNAIESATEFDSNCSDNNRLEVVVGMTDGESNSDTEWSPHAVWGSTVTESTYSPGTYTKKGLINAPPMVFTIGLGVTHDTNYPTAPAWSHTYSPSGSVEYDLWNCADKTPWPYGKYGRDFNSSSSGYSAMPEFDNPDPNIGHYYYTTDSSQLGDIFTSIREMVQSIASGSGQTAGNGNVTRAADNSLTGTRAALSGPTTNALETRYMRSDTQNVNGLNADILGTTQSTSYTSAYIGYGTAYAGIRVWKRSSSGTETEITSGSAVAVASTTSRGTIVSSTWTCPLTSLSTTDSIVVRVYAEDDDPTPDELAAEFTTEQLGAVQLDAATWTVYYYLDGFGYDYFYWGDSTANSRIEGFSYSLPPAPPGVEKAYPADGKTALPSQYVAVVFNRSLDTSTTPTLAQTGGTDPGNWNFEGWFSTHNSSDTAIWSHDNWTAGDTVTLTVSNYVDSSGTYTGDPYTWSFKVYSFTAGGGGGSSTTTNTNKTAVTESFDLSNVDGAVLTFWHKYSIVPGMNGAFIELGYKNESSGNWDWIYLIPGQGAYTGNLNLSVTRTDSEGTPIVWGWNGVSGKGTFSWEFVKVNLKTVVDQHVPSAYRDEIRIKFNYTQYGLGTGYGWYIDDVKVVASRSDSASVAAGDSDIWQMVDTDDTTYSYGDAHSGNHAWWNGDPSTGWFRAGIDNSLISRPIDLTNAWNAELSAYFKFNINDASGAPPDGFRVEISRDGGVTWTAINLGVRSGEGVSGTAASNYWVEAGDLTRLNVDLTAFRGDVIVLRFRVVTTNAPTYDHYEDPNAGFGGFYVDDVVISGESLGS